LRERLVLTALPAIPTPARGVSAPRPPAGYRRPAARGQPISGRHRPFPTGAGAPGYSPLMLADTHVAPVGIVGPWLIPVQDPLAPRIVWNSGHRSSWPRSCAADRSAGRHAYSSGASSGPMSISGHQRVTANSSMM